MGGEIIGEAGRDQHVTPVELRKVDGSPQRVQVAVTEFQDGEADTLNELDKVGVGGQVVAAFFDQQGRDQGLILPRKGPCDAGDSYFPSLRNR